MSRFTFTLGLIILISACSGLKPLAPEGKSTSAVVTGVSSGRANVPDEKMYGLRVASGRVYFVTQSLNKPLKEGDTVELEMGSKGSAHIHEK